MGRTPSHSEPGGVSDCPDEGGKSERADTRQEKLVPWWYCNGPTPECKEEAVAGVVTDDEPSGSERPSLRGHRVIPPPARGAHLLVLPPPLQTCRFTAEEQRCGIEG